MLVDTIVETTLLYGCRVRCALPLPFPLGTPADGPPELVATPGPVDAPADYRHDDFGWWRVDGRGNDYGFRDVGRFAVARAGSITVDVPPGVDWGLVAHVLGGVVMAGALLQRGAYVLHGNAVEVGSEAVAFVGASTAGKSTMAAAMVQRGHRLVSDDLVVVPHVNVDACIVPGVPRLKLFPAAISAIGRDPDECPPIYEGIDKRVLAVDMVSASAKPRLAAVYLLEDHSRLEIDPVSAHVAHLQLLAQAFRPDVTTATLGREAYFRAAAALAGRVPVFRLKRPRDLVTLAEVARAVETHRIGAATSTSHRR